MKEEWLFPNTFVPVDVETTSALIVEIKRLIDVVGGMALAQPAQEPVSVTYKEVADAMNSLWNGTLEQHQIAEQMANKKLYTTPQQRPWVGLTDEDQFNLVHAMNKNDWHAIQMMDAIEAKLKEKNA